MNKTSKMGITAMSIITAVVVGFAGMASATPPAFDAVDAVTDLLSSNIGAVVAIAVAMAAISIPVALFFTYGNRALALVTGRTKKVKL